MSEQQHAMDGTCNANAGTNLAADELSADSTTKGGHATAEVSRLAVAVSLMFTCSNLSEKLTY